MEEIIDLINEMSPYILLGFLLAGLMHAFISPALYHRYLGGNTFRSVVYAALLGIPLPLCSCGVIPTAMSLYKEGASKGATISFLIATPQTGVDSIIATYSLMGLPFALLRPIAALFTALFGGAITNLWSHCEPQLAKSHTCCCCEDDDCNDDDCDDNNESECGCGCGCGCHGEKGEVPVTFWQKTVKALHYAFIEMMGDIGKWLLVGLLVAGLITVFVPASFFSMFADKPLLSMLLVLVCAMPMYLCATGSIPIAVALMLKGLSPGTALVLLMAGPAVNAASMIVIGQVMGKRTVWLYLLSIIMGAVACGLMIDYLLPHEWFTVPLNSIHHSKTEGVPVFSTICSILLLAMILYARYNKKRTSHKCCG
ncbi:MAG: SO_0444 family Cu/Zn efflux transporter [Prevotella sp.]